MIELVENKFPYAKIPGGGFPSVELYLMLYLAIALFFIHRIENKKLYKEDQEITDIGFLDYIGFIYPLLWILLAVNGCLLIKSYISVTLFTIFRVIIGVPLLILPPIHYILLKKKINQQ